MKPPDDLKEWSKNDLVREVRRLRAVMREHAEQVNPAHSGGGIAERVQPRVSLLLDAATFVAPTDPERPQDAPTSQEP